MEARSNKLQAKDLINVGIFTATYFVIFFAGMMLGYIPISIPLLGLVCPILCGISFMLYLTKVKKFGMVSLTGIILGLLNLVMGSGVLVLIFGIIFGVLGDVILRTGKYQSWKCTLLGNGVFSLWIMGYVSRMFLTRDTFFASLVSSYGQEYVDTLMSYTPGWTYPVLFVVTFIGGILGALLGKAVLKKHFEKAGISCSERLNTRCSICSSCRILIFRQGFFFITPSSNADCMATESRRNAPLTVLADSPTARMFSENSYAKAGVNCVKYKPPSAGRICLFICIRYV